MTMVDMSRVEIKQEPYPVLKCTVLFIHLKKIPIQRLEPFTLI